MDISKFREKSKELRKDILKMVYAAQSGHPGWSFSAIDLLTVLFFWWYFYSDPESPKNENRDFFILSKWHASPAYYSVLAELWYFSKDEHFSFRQIDSILQWHPMPKVPWVEVATWSLWQWLSVANWIAMWLKLDKKENKVFALLWDWELQEWQIWEAAMSAGHYKTDNLVAIIDNNWLQIDWDISEIMDVWNIWDKFRAFRWEVIEVDWHDFEKIDEAFKKAISVKWKPCAIVADTVKWKWVSFMENQAGWHGKAPSDEQYKDAELELNK